MQSTPASSEMRKGKEPMLPNQILGGTSRTIVIKLGMLDHDVLSIYRSKVLITL